MLRHVSLLLVLGAFLVNASAGQDLCPVVRATSIEEALSLRIEGGPYSVPDDVQREANELLRDILEVNQEFEDLAQAGGISDEERQSRQMELLQRAEALGEDALKLNPCSLQIRRFLLDRIYSGFASAPIEPARRIGRLLKMDLLIPADPDVAWYLADAYEETRQYLDMAAVLRKAQQAFPDGPDFDDDRVYFLLRQADGYRGALEPDSLAAVLSRAEKLPRTDEQQAELEVIVSYLNWDDGNLEGRAAADKAWLALNEGRYAEARIGAREALGLTRGSAAKQEMLQLLGYAFWDDDQSDSAAVYIRLAVSIGGPATSEIREDYGKLTNELAQAVSGDDPAVAAAYLLQSGQIPWAGQALALRGLAVLFADRNEMAEEFAQRALAVASTPEDRRRAHALLAEIRLRLGKYEMAKQHQEDARLEDH